MSNKITWLLAPVSTLSKVQGHGETLEGKVHRLTHPLAYLVVLLRVVLMESKIKLMLAYTVATLYI